MIGSRFAAAVASSLLLILPARAADVLRIAMTASDIPTTTGALKMGGAWSETTRAASSRARSPQTCRFSRPRK
jgi:hypothetical protein